MDMSRWIIINTDGTRNGRSDDYPTNVRKFHIEASRSGHISLYFAGPGDEDETNFFSGLFGSAFGVGCNDICDRAIDAFKAVYRPGDRIAATGFSRGASNARRIAYELGNEGYTVDFVGVWDTVHAMLPFGELQQDTLFGDLHVHPNVKKAAHAVSIDEDRAAFTPNLMEPREGVTEVWFKGNHCDVGGGHPDEENGLSSITLQWMVDQAKEAGLNLDPFTINAGECVVHKEEWRGLRRPRVVPEGALTWDYRS